MPEVITDNLDLWTSALLTKTTAGRGSNGKLEAYGIKKLRELILELAVRGKLVPQDPNDEPASVLLEKFAKERARLIKEGGVRKQKELSPIAEDEMPFVLPKNWAVERLGAVSHLITKGTTPTTLGHAYVDSGITFVKVENIDRGRIQGDSISQFIDEETNQALERSQLAEGDVLFSIAGTIGKTCIVYEQDLPANTNQALAIIRGTSTAFDTRYLLIQLDSYVAEATRAKARGGAMPNVSLGDLTVLVLPVPPLAEQHRIVAKVDELMALCDQLEQQQTHSIEAHQTLVASLLGTLTRHESQQEFSAALARIASHFDTLFTTEASIDQLKQTILQLAVMGKLVHQDKNEESASVLLERIAQQKVRLANAGEIRQQKPLSNIGEEERLFELPIGWKWCRLHEIVYLLGDGLHGTPEYTLNEKFYFVNGNNLNDGQIVIKSETKTVTRDQYDKYKKPLGENSVLVSINGTLGNVAFYNNEAIILGKSACFFNLAEDIYKRFIKVVIDAPSFADYSDKNATGSTIKNLGLSAMNALPIALPPKEEQHRIVAKVDELMALCDTLKARLADAQAIQLHLADAIVEQAVC